MKQDKRNYEGVYFKLLVEKDDFPEDEKINNIIKLLNFDNKYYFYSYIIMREPNLIIDWFMSIENFIGFIEKLNIKKVYKLKLINEIFTSNIINEEEKYINELK